MSLLKPMLSTLTMGMMAIHHRNAWWEHMAWTVSALGHNHRSARGARKRLQDTLGACKCKQCGATARGVSVEKALQQCLQGEEAVLCPLMQWLLLEGQGVKSHPGEMPMTAHSLCMCLPQLLRDVAWCPLGPFMLTSQHTPHHVPIPTIPTGPLHCHGVPLQLLALLVVCPRECARLGTSCRITKGPLHWQGLCAPCPLYLPLLH